MSIAMSEFRLFGDTPPLDDVASCNSVRDGILLGLVLFTLVRTSEALAGDHASITQATLDPGVDSFRRLPASATMMAAPADFTAPTDAGNQMFSSTDFRPRKHTLFDSDPSVTAFSDPPMLRGTTVWQRMSDYKSHDRVRLLTLWESTGSTVSLQAGKRGDPSLQWTSRLMNRGGSTRGLFDQWFSVSLFNAGNRLRGASRSTNAPVTPRQANMPVVAGLK